MSSVKYCPFRLCLNVLMLYFTEAIILVLTFMLERMNINSTQDHYIVSDTTNFYYTAGALCQCIKVAPIQKFMSETFCMNVFIPVYMHQ